MQGTQYRTFTAQEVIKHPINPICWKSRACFKWLSLTFYLFMLMIWRQNYSVDSCGSCGDGQSGGPKWEDLSNNLVKLNAVLAPNISSKWVFLSDVNDFVSIILSTNCCLCLHDILSVVRSSMFTMNCCLQASIKAPQIQFVIHVDWQSCFPVPWGCSVSCCASTRCWAVWELTSLSASLVILAAPLGTRGCIFRSNRPHREQKVCF